jgi:RNA polymerase sigma-70 factor (ECF subfamily)
MSLKEKHENPKTAGAPKLPPSLAEIPAKNIAAAEDFRQIDPAQASHIQEGEEPSGDENEAARAAQVRREKLKISFRLLAEGRLSAMGDVYDALGKGLFGYLRAFLGEAPDAEDVLQEVFVKLAEHRKKLVRVENPHAYVFAIARNEALKLIRQKTRARPIDPEHVMFQKIAPTNGSPELSPREAHDALLTIPPEQREVVLLKIYEGFTFAEIGRLTGVSPNTAASRYRYALSKLAGRLKKYRGVSYDG